MRQTVLQERQKKTQFAQLFRQTACLLQGHGAKSKLMIFFGKKNYSEKELVLGCIANDRRAQEALYRRFFPEMLRMVRYYIKDEDIAIEVVNNGMLRVFKKIYTYAFIGSLEGWVRRLVYRCMADHFRQKEHFGPMLVLEDHELSVSETCLDALYEEDILKAVTALPATSQKVFRMFVIEGYSHAKIADSLKISEGTSKWHLCSARQKLREMLRPETIPDITPKNM